MYQILFYYLQNCELYFSHKVCMDRETASRTDGRTDGHQSNSKSNGTFMCHIHHTQMHNTLFTMVVRVKIKTMTKT